MVRIFFKRFIFPYRCDLLFLAWIVVLLLSTIHANDIPTFSVTSTATATVTATATSCDSGRNSMSSDNTAEIAASSSSCQVVLLDGMMTSTSTKITDPISSSSSLPTTSTTKPTTSTTTIKNNNDDRNNDDNLQRDNNDTSSLLLFGVEQLLEAEGYHQVTRIQTLEQIQLTQRYMQERQQQQNNNNNNNDSPESMPICRNEHELCSIWVVQGECNSNPTFMKQQCAPACQSCHYLTIEGRCPIDENGNDVWGPEDLNALFTKLTNEPYKSKYNVEILSAPASATTAGSGGKRKSVITSGSSSPPPFIIMGRPWVITMDDIISEKEAEILIELGAIEGYKTSTGVGGLHPNGTYIDSINMGRTSTNAFCMSEICYQNATAQQIMNRLANLTDTPIQNSEFIQLLKYEPGQYYQLHSDFIPHEVRRQQGVRILTVYLYLNDVEEGGGTRFDKLNVTVLPKRGRAVLWPSVRNKNPNTPDYRTDHQALPVIKGVKYGANVWIHQRDFKTPHSNSCI